MDDLIGVPFVNKGRRVSSGLDCWGLVIEVFRRYGINIPDFIVDADAQRTIDKVANNETSSEDWIEVEHPAHNDAPLVVLMRPKSRLITHAGVYLADDTIIHSTQSTGVIRTPVRLLHGMIAGYYRLCL